MTSMEQLDDEAIAGIIHHMNEDHKDALTLYLTAFAGVDSNSIDDIESIQMTAIDRDGINIAFTLKGKQLAKRILFTDTGAGTSILNRAQARSMLVDMVNIARQ